MPFKQPTLPELVERSRQSFRNEMPGTDAWLWPNNVNVSAKAMAGMTHLNFQWLSYIAKQRWVHTADGEFLDQHGIQYGIPRHAATYARGRVILFGIEGTIVPGDVLLVRGDGFEYTISQGGIVDGTGQVVVDVTAKNYGAVGNAMPGTGLTVGQAMTGLGGDGMVHDDGIGLGADEEGDESYRARLLFRLRMPPRGGAAHDYVAWARQIPGVTRVFVDALASGPGTVTVYFLMDDTYPNGIPQPTDVAAVQAYIDTVRPVTAMVTVAAPVPADVDITISGLSPDTVAVREAIKGELADLFVRDVRVSLVSRPFILYRSKLWQAIAQATGEDYHVLEVPADDLPFDEGELPILGTVTFA